MEIKIVDYSNSDFIKLCNGLEMEHLNIIREQRSPNGNCLKNLDKFTTIIIAYINNIPVGCLAMKDIINGCAEIGKLYVLPDYRKMGVATQMFKYLENVAKEKCASKMILDTYNRFLSAISLYKKLGFYEIDNYVDNSPYSICMEKIISN